MSKGSKGRRHKSYSANSLRRHMRQGQMPGSNRREIRQEKSEQLRDAPKRGIRVWRADDLG